MRKQVKDFWRGRVLTDERKDYARRKRRVFRVAAAGVERERLFECYKALDDRKCDEVTVWFYDTPEEIERGLPYTVAMIERTGRRAVPVLTYR